MDTKLQFSRIFSLKYYSIIVFCLLFQQQIYSQQNNWTFVVNDISNTMYMYIDKNTVKLQNGNIQVWQKIVEINNSITIGLVEWNCSKKQIRVVKENIYTISMELVSVDNRIGPWSYFSPDSLSVSVYDIVCKKDKQNTVNASKKVSIAEITTTAASLRESPSINGNLIREVSFGEQLILANEEPVGSWYKVIDKETQTEGWLHKINFKIIKPISTKNKSMVSKVKKRS